MIPSGFMELKKTFDNLGIEYKATPEDTKFTEVWSITLSDKRISGVDTEGKAVYTANNEVTFNFGGPGYWNLQIRRVS